MAHLAIVTYPELDGSDSRWLADIRATHDPQSGLIAAHFTLVFPCMADADAVASEMAAVASSTPAIRVRFTRTEAIPDAFGAGAHVFLLPDEDAAAALTTVHECLYAGVLRPHLRADLPFIPHVTMSGGPEMRECQRLAASLQERAARVSGTLSELVLVDVTTGPVTPLARYRLGSPSGTNVSGR